MYLSWWEPTTSLIVAVLKKPNIAKELQKLAKWPSEVTKRQKGNGKVSTSANDIDDDDVESNPPSHADDDI